MLGRTRKWEERRKLLASRMPTIRIDRCVVTKDKKRGYRIEILGLGMIPAFSPPKVIVGDQEVLETRFEPAGRLVTGFLTDPPTNDSVVVDLGYARAEGLAEMR